METTSLLCNLTRWAIRFNGLDGVMIFSLSGKIINTFLNYSITITNNILILFCDSNGIVYFCDLNLITHGLLVKF